MKYYSIAMQENKFMKIFYGDTGVSSTNIIHKIKHSETEKGEEAKGDLLQQTVD